MWCTWYIYIYRERERCSPSKASLSRRSNMVADLLSLCFSPSGSRKHICTNPWAPVEETTGPHRVDNKQLKNPRTLLGVRTWLWRTLSFCFSSPRWGQPQCSWAQLNWPYENWLISWLLCCAVLCSVALHRAASRFALHCVVCRCLALHCFAMRCAFGGSDQRIKTQHSRSKASTNNRHS